MKPPEITYSTREAARLARVTPRQLQHMDETDVVSPERARGALAFHPASRRYTERDIERIRFVAKLRERGLGTKAIRGVLRQTERAAGRAEWLAIFNRRCQFFESARELIAYAAAVPGGVLTLEIPRHA